MLVWKNSNGLHRVLISTPLNTLMMSWNTNCMQGLLTQHHCLNSLMLLWLNEHNPHSNFPKKNNVKPSLKSGVIATRQL